MRRILCGIGLAALFGTLTVQANVIACSDVSTLEQLIGASGPGLGCYNEDLIFNNFKYMGGGVITAAQVNATAFFTPGDFADVQSWSFAPMSANLTTHSKWTTAFTLSYDVSVCRTVTDGCLDPEPFSRIRASANSMNSIGFGNNTTTMTDTESMGTLVLTGASSAQLTYGEQITIHTSSAAALASGFPILSYTQDFLESTPEPATYPMMAGGLLAVLACLACKKLKKAQVPAIAST